ncbi:MAG TPA: AbrB/MazE/SpoVT family DNA-binding domain-containing protein [Rhizobiaceae bacterium]|nr:AbrB/MazE/SpoVT family DNA-binding domain-containing protein [Rhizobiaceae bacterium]
MVVLTITAKGQVTLKKEILRELGVKPGQKVRADVSEGELRLRPLKKGGDLDGFFGSLHDPDGPTLTIDEMNEIIADAWAGKR